MRVGLLSAALVLLAAHGSAKTDPKHVPAVEKASPTGDRGVAAAAVAILGENATANGTIAAPPSAPQNSSAPPVEQAMAECLAAGAASTLSTGDLQACALAFSRFVKGGGCKNATSQLADEGSSEGRQKAATACAEAFEGGLASNDSKACFAATGVSAASLGICFAKAEGSAALAAASEAVSSSAAAVVRGAESLSSYAMQAMETTGKASVSFQREVQRVWSKSGLRKFLRQFSELGPSSPGEGLRMAQRSHHSHALRLGVAASQRSQSKAMALSSLLEPRDDALGAVAAASTTVGPEVARLEEAFHRGRVEAEQRGGLSEGAEDLRFTGSSVRAGMSKVAEQIVAGVRAVSGAMWRVVKPYW
jgi:hypothetical protein